MRTFIVSYQAVHRFKLVIEAEDKEAALSEARVSTGDALWTGVSLANFKADEVFIEPDAS